MSSTDVIALDPGAWEDAWPQVLEAIERAIDVPGLPPEDRAALARLHDTAGYWGGRPALAIPAALTHYASTRPNPKVHELPVDLIRRLTTSAFQSLLRADLRTVGDLQQCIADGTLPAVPGIGPKSAATILEALAGLERSDPTAAPQEA